MEIPFQGLDGEGGPPLTPWMVRTSAAPLCPSPPSSWSPASGVAGLAVVEKTGCTASVNKSNNRNMNMDSTWTFPRILTTVVTIQTGTPVIFKQVSNCC